MIEITTTLTHRNQRIVYDAELINGNLLSFQSTDPVLENCVVAPRLQYTHRGKTLDMIDHFNYYPGRSSMQLTHSTIYTGKDVGIDQIVSIVTAVGTFRSLKNLLDK